MGERDGRDRPRLRLVRRGEPSSEPVTTEQLEPPEIQELRKSGKWETLERVWALDDRQTEAIFSDAWDELPSTPANKRWVRELREVQFAWRAEVFRLAGITQEEWTAYKSFKLGPDKEDEEGDDDDGDTDDW